MPYPGWRFCVIVATWSLAASAPGAAGARGAFEAPIRSETSAAPAPAKLVAGSDDQLREAIREGYERSATFRGLVDHLADHRTAVHVHWVPGLTGSLSACLLHRVAVSPDGARLLWVAVRNNQPSDTLVALIAHELQHAHEALDAGVSSDDEIARVFELLGHRTGSHGRVRRLAVYETKAARDIQDQVTRELRSAAPPTHDPAR